MLSQDHACHQRPALELRPQRYLVAGHPRCARKLIAAQGQRFNPLNHLNLAHSFAFIDGDSAEERDWALRQGAPDKLWIVLVKGSPTDLMKATQRRFYFDQMGA
jgi:hypothetical protein